MTAEVRRRVELAALLAVGIAPFYLNGFYNVRLAAVDRSLFWIVEALTWIIMPAILLVAGRRRGLYTFTELGLSTRVRASARPWLLLPLIVAIAFVFVQLEVTVAVWAHRALPSGWPLPGFRYTDVIPPRTAGAGWYRLLALTHLCVTAGVVEELYYRAAMNRLFTRGLIGGLCYVAISSLIFAGVHWEGGLPNLVEAFAIGVFAAIVFRMTGNLWPLIAGHILTDWYWFTGGPAGG